MEFATIDTPIGGMLLGASVEGSPALIGSWFFRQKYYPELPFLKGREVSPLAAASGPAAPLLREAAKQLAAYFAGKLRQFDLPLGPKGTPFQQAVWRVLSEIPYNQSIAYSEVALRAGRPAAVRAAGGAVGHNPLGIIVPCHRVIGKNGSLTGFAGGLDRKIFLLALEAGENPKPLPPA